MRNSITRTMVESVIHSCVVKVIDGQPVTENLEPVTVMGKITEEKALKAVTKAHGVKNGLAIVKIEESEVKYEISVEDFMKHAKKIEKDGND